MLPIDATHRMTQLHVVRVFIGPGGTGGNLLGVFLNGGVIPPERRMAVTAELGFSESVFVDDVATGRMAIFVPTSELPFAGHPTVGTAWLLGEVGRPVDVLRPPAGDVPTWREGDMTWIGARARWVDFRVLPNFVEFATVEEVDALPGSHKRAVAVRLGVGGRAGGATSGPFLPDVGGHC